ncbi:MAG: hypothetical protein RLY86_2202 [Pseudomonadota bacterium]|jgi:nucleoside 2-deoxyribosyltransferase
MTPAPRIYLAGPEVFLPDPAAAAVSMKQICAGLGLDGMFPQDSQLVRGLAEGPATFAARIRAANLDLVRLADGVIANVTPFRGPGADDGTAFEIGAAVALGKPVFLWSAEAGTLLDRTRRRQPVTLAGDIWRDADGMEVEEFGLPVNLMLIDPARPEVHGDFTAAARACAAWFGR